ncbi:MAG: hypothetical protein HYY06_25055 [Deltaproteobacteria bacterium]|nr:hypothetical protein [Deltaproteobacteria bacterium]
MEELVSRIEETGHNVKEQGESFVTATRHAGLAFAKETRRASTDLFGAARAEATSWRRFLQSRVARRIRRLAAARDLERRFLARLDRAIVRLGRRVRARLARLEGRRAPARVRRGAPRRAARTRKAAAAPA